MFHIMCTEVTDFWSFVPVMKHFFTTDFKYKNSFSRFFGKNDELKHI